MKANRLLLILLLTPFMALAEIRNTRAQRAEIIFMFTIPMAIPTSIICSMLADLDATTYRLTIINTMLFSLFFWQHKSVKRK